MSDTTRTDIKSHTHTTTLTSTADTRRQAFLLAQRDARRDLTTQARRLVQVAISHKEDGQEQAHDDGSEEIKTEEDATLDMDDIKTSPMKQQDTRDYYASQLTTPTYLDTLPHDLHTWYVTPRPEGTRCLVIANRGLTVSRKRNGQLLHRFPSALPNGSG